ncbi:unnamed protein product [Leuciscus chuanchicus]
MKTWENPGRKPDVYPSDPLDSAQLFGPCSPELTVIKCVQLRVNRVCVCPVNTVQCAVVIVQNAEVQTVKDAERERSHASVVDETQQMQRRYRERERERAVRSSRRLLLSVLEVCGVAGDGRTDFLSLASRVLHLSVQRKGHPLGRPCQTLHSQNNFQRKEKEEKEEEEEGGGKCDKIRKAKPGVLDEVSELER